MTIEALLQGEVRAKPEEHTSRKGNPYATMLLLATMGDGFVFCLCTAFDEAVRAQLLALEAGDKVSISGELTASLYETGGDKKVRIECTVDGVLTAYHVRRKRFAMWNAEQPADLHPDFEGSLH